MLFLVVYYGNMFGYGILNLFFDVFVVVEFVFCFLGGYFVLKCY